MRPPIIDQFTDLPVSRQRKWSLRQHLIGKCQVCGEPVATAAHCLKHAVDTREGKRRRMGSVIRVTSSKTYLLESREAAR